MFYWSPDQRKRVQPNQPVTGAPVLVTSCPVCYGRVTQLDIFAGTRDIGVDWVYEIPHPVDDKVMFHPCGHVLRGLDAGDWLRSQGM